MQRADRTWNRVCWTLVLPHTLGATQLTAASKFKSLQETWSQSTRSPCGHYGDRGSEETAREHASTGAEAEQKHHHLLLPFHPWIKGNGKLCQQGRPNYKICGFSLPSTEAEHRWLNSVKLGEHESPSSHFVTRQVLCLRSFFRVASNNDH